MDGCVYPYRHVAPAAEHPFHRAALGIARDAIVIGAFVSRLKLSRRCLTLWRDVLERDSAARLAFSPVNPGAARALRAPARRRRHRRRPLLFLPQGRDDAENQARYALVDFVLDPMPYGGVNGTLEALDMGVPVVTLRGRRHGERTSYSILANLGVTETVAQSGTRVRRHRRAARGRSRIHARRARSASARASRIRRLTDMPAHTRHLEAAYLAALAAKAPEVLADAGEPIDG